MNMMASVLAWSPDSVWLLLQKTWWFLVVLGILVAFHELGHFLAARWVGVKVLKFSLGFGPKLLGRQVGETEYLVSAIPLGGYVKLFGEEETEAITPEDRRRSFSHQSLWGKVLIVAAGPGFNFILAYLIFAAWLATGYTLPVPSFKDIAPVLEAVAPDSPAAKAGLMVGDQIKKIDGRDIATRVELLDAADTRGPSRRPHPNPHGHADSGAGADSTERRLRLLPGDRRDSTGRQ
jgi:regulator of sigma E protease